MLLPRILVHTTHISYTLRMKKIKLLATALAVCLLLVGCASTSKKVKNGTPLVWDAANKKGQLSNGMSYYVRKNSEPKNRITLRLAVKAGSCMEDDDQKGVAHFVEHMAFNGTEHFEKSAIVDYFEKIGMNFGADLNAYTTFEQTVYQLEVPADDPEMLETALLILKDWATAITFDQEQVDLERGVVTEEWRLSQGLQGRVSDAQIALLMKDSRFADRLPIGDMDVIKNVSRDRVVDFYKKWYRPEFMSLVIVGDAETDVLESALKKTMGEIPASTSKLKLPKYTVPVQKDQNISFLKDPEQAYTIIQIFSQEEDTTPSTTVEDIRKNTARNIGDYVFNQRLNELAMTPDSVWLQAFNSSATISNFTTFYYMTVVPKDGMFTECLQKVLDEYDRFMNFGVTESEVARIKTAFLAETEQNYNNRDKTYSSIFAENIVTADITGAILVDDTEYYNLMKEIIPAITIEEINTECRNAIADRGNLMFVQSSDKTELPSKEEILKIWKNRSNSNLSAYQDDVSDDQLMVRPAAKGKVTSKKEIAELGVNEYILENGVRILTKKTDFEADTIIVRASSKGGTYQVSDEDVPSVNAGLNYVLLSGLNGMSYNQLIKKLTALNVGMNGDVTNTQEYLQGNIKADRIEPLLQLMYLFFTTEQFTKDGWNTLMPMLKEEARGFGSQPSQVFNARINEILYGNDIRYAPFNSDYVSKINQESAKKVFKERFGNPADFTYTFVGDIDEAELIDLCSYYLGTLKTSSDREETVYKYYNFPNGKISETVKKGIDKQGYTFMAFGGDLPAEPDIEVSFKEEFILYELEDLLNIKLRESIREDKSGSYGVGVDCNIEGYPKRFHRTQIGFGCEPERGEELADEVIAQIKKIQSEPISEDDIAKLKETARRERETNLRSNSWWLGKIEAVLVFTYQPLWYASDIEKAINWITVENIQAAANKYLNTENYVQVFLQPE